jgi:hypothetical protein
MRAINMTEEQERQAFALRAAQRFAEKPNVVTFTDEDVENGCWFAVRWGFCERAVLVFKTEEPVLYGDLVPFAEEAP